MKKLAIITFALIALVACGNKTKTQESVALKSVKEYIDKNFEYPRGTTITDIKIDTFITNHAAREMYDLISDTTIAFNQIIYDTYISDITKKHLKSYDTIALLDTTLPDVRYTVVIAKVRHRCGNDMCMCKVYVTMRNNEVVNTFVDGEMDFRQSLEQLIPPQILEIMDATMTISDAYNEILSAWD